MNLKRIISVFLISILTLGMCSIAYAVDDTPDVYTPIYTAEDFNNIRNNLSDKYILMNDIDLSSYEKWVPIGTELSAFKGEIDGNNKSINGLCVSDVIESTNRASAGLFAFVSGAVIKNLNVIDADIVIQKETDHFYSVGVISGNSKYSVFENCKVSGSVIAEVNGTCSAGGITGEITLDSAINNCENTADINVNGKYELYVGGIVGSASSPITICHNAGNITVNNSKSLNKEFDSICVGGVCGNMFLEEISNCYNTGNIVVDCLSDYSGVGGIGGSTFSVSDCYSIGNITYSNQPATESTGGISGKVVYFFNGLGMSENKESFITNCYCLDNSSKAVGNIVSEQVSNVSILSEEDMKKQSSYIGFDFENIWKMEENGYPVFGKSETSVKPTYNIIDAEIIYVPLKNRIVFSFGSPALPDGIVVKLTYNDGTVKTVTIKGSDEGYFANEERVTGSVRASVVEYGLLTDYLFFNDGQIKIEYRYLVIPPILTIIKNLIVR